MSEGARDRVARPPALLEMLAPLVERPGEVSASGEPRREGTVQRAPLDRILGSARDLSQPAPERLGLGSPPQLNQRRFVVLPDSICSSARWSRRALWIRLSGFFSRQRKISRDSSGFMSARRSRGEGGAALRCMRRMSDVESAVNGRRPVAISNITSPSE